MISFLKDFIKKEKRVYLDYAGATPISEKSTRALASSLLLYGNPSAIHHEGDVASRVLDKARALCATTLNAHSYEVYFVGSGTESCNLAILGTVIGARDKVEQLGCEDATSQQALAPLGTSIIPHVITTTIEHPAVLEPIRTLEKEGKVRVTYLPVYEDGIVKIHDIREALCEETVLVSVMYANNEIGTMQPVKEIGRALDEWKDSHGRTHNEYPYFHIDACQAGNYCNLDVVRLRAHLMTVNSSKVYGPKGIALLYKKEGCRVDPISFGGGQERGLRSGTESVALAYAFAVALEEAQAMKEKESARLRELRDVCRDELMKEIPEATVYGAWDEYKQQVDERRRGNTSHSSANVLKEEKRLPNNINCRIPGIPSDEMILRLDAKGFAVSHKSACASSETDGSYVIEALGASKEEALENVRITLGRETTRQDILALVQAMKDIYDSFAKK
jgi:cysteine desulfurase